MFKLFRKNQKNVDKKPVSEEPLNKKYTDPELYQALEEDGIAITEQDIQKARENDAETLYKIGDIYYKNKEYSKSFLWFYKAARQDHADSQAQVGRMYCYGQGVSRDFKQAMDWYLKAASTDNARAQYNIGFLYHYGMGVSTDYKQAMNWYLKAANNGHATAMYEIGGMYRNGSGVIANIPTAIEWFTKAANQGNIIAQFDLGLLYQYQDGYKDLQKAVIWYQKAVDNGHDYAKSKVKKLSEQGYYAQEEQREIETIQHNNAADAIINDQSQPSTLNSNDEHPNKTIGDKIEGIGKIFQSKMSFMEVSTDTLQKELAALKQKELQQHEENMKLRDELAKLKAIKKESTNNDLNYDSSNNANDSEGGRNNATEYLNSEEQQDNNNITANKTRMEENNNTLQRELTALEQTQLQQHEDNSQLRNGLTMLNAGEKDIINNDASYNSSDNKHDSNNDINYDSESTNSEEEEEGANEENNTASKHKENKLPEKELVKTEPIIQDNANNNPYYDTSDNDNDNDFNYDTECSDGEEEEEESNSTAKKNAEEVNNVQLQKELASLKQKELEQDKENRLLKERLARIKAGLEDEAHNDPNCYSSDDESDKNNDFNYDSECSTGKENAMANTQQSRNNRPWFETPADPNYDSSDNEDPRNDV